MKIAINFAKKPHQGLFKGKLQEIREADQALILCLHSGSGLITVSKLVAPFKA